MIKAGGQHVTDPRVIHVQASGFEIRAPDGEEGSLLNIDGDVEIAVGSDPVTVTVKRQCWLTVSFEQ
eukprot:SAG31_NODE_2691_length_5240_cov_1.866174_2_plen_67_part_00